MFYARPLLLLSLVVSTASCTAESATEPSVSPTISFNKIGKSVATRPAGGTCAVTALVVPPFPFLPPFAPIIHLEIEGVCNLRHMGRTTLVSTEVINLGTGVVTNTATWTAANGDQIMSEFAGNGPPTDGDNATFAGVITYVSGTGRFEGVSGTVNAEGNSHFTGLTGVGEYRMNGTITY